MKKVENELLCLEKDIKSVNAKVFVCKSDAEKEWERFRKEHRNSLYTYDVAYVETRVEKRKRGNPGKNPKPPTIETKWNLNIRITGNDDKRMETFRRSEESFVLITNVKPDEHSIVEVLRQYKNRHVVEVSFRYFKEPNPASVIYLKNEDRIKALMMVLSVSLMIRALMQYEMRKGYKESKEPLPRVGWNGNKLQPGLTAHFLSVAMQNEYFIKEGKSRYYYTFSKPFSELRVVTLLGLMGMCVEDLLG